MQVTLDTNIILQALSKSQGASAQIIEAVLVKEIILALSIGVFKEYEAVLSRPELQRKLGYTNQDMQYLMTALLRFAKRQKYTTYGDLI